MTIHSALLPLVRSASTTRIRFTAFLRRWPEVVRTSPSSVSESSLRSSRRRISKMVSAPMPARNTSPYLSLSSR